MKVRIRYQAFLALDSRGPRIVEPGTIIEMPAGSKVGKWGEILDAPAAAPVAPPVVERSPEPATPVVTAAPAPASTVVYERNPRRVKRTDQDVL
jgi:hypothetical protein